MSHGISPDHNQLPAGALSTPAATPAPSAMASDNPRPAPKRLSAGQIQKHYAFYHKVSSDANHLRTAMTPSQALAAVFGSYPLQSRQA